MDRTAMLERAMEIAEEDGLDGICTTCGEEQPMEPDGRDGICESCDSPTVQGWGILLEVI